MLQIENLMLPRQHLGSLRQLRLLVKRFWMRWKLALMVGMSKMFRLRRLWNLKYAWLRVCCVCEISISCNIPRAVQLIRIRSWRSEKFVNLITYLAVYLITHGVVHWIVDSIILMARVKRKTWEKLLMDVHILVWTCLSYFLSLALFFYRFSFWFLSFPVNLYRRFRLLCELLRNFGRLPVHISKFEITLYPFPVVGLFALFHVLGLILCFRNDRKLSFTAFLIDFL